MDGLRAATWCMLLSFSVLHVQLVHCKRVVVLPMPFTSHTKYHTNVARALQAKGHQIWLTMPSSIVSAGNLDTSGFTVVEYQTTTQNAEEDMMIGFRDKYFANEWPDWSLFISVLRDHTDSLLSNNTFYQEIKAIKPDLIIIDNIPTLKVMCVLAYRLGVPFAYVGSAYEPLAQRLPFSPAATPVPLFTFTNTMTFPQRLANTFIYFVSSIKDMACLPDAVARYAPEMPYLPLDVLVARAELWLVEMDHILDYPRPQLPNVKLIGGTATGPAKPLKEPFKSFVEGAGEKGVVVVSFGSYVLELPNEVSTKVLKALAALPMKSIFRSNLTSPMLGKILTAPWIPQNDLLGHPKTKAFVSHCGKNGQYEALFHAVPVLATPIFADQPYNAERMRHRGFAEKVDLRTVGADEFRDAIIQVATDGKYKAAISRASEIFKAEFGVPMERAAFWLDHVMTYGGTHMRSSSQTMPFYQFLCLDIIAVYLSVILFLVWLATKILLGILRLLLNKCFCKQKTE